MIVLLACAGENGFSCEEGLLRSVEKSGLVLSRGEGLLLNVGGGGRTREMKVGRAGLQICGRGV